MLKSSLVFCLSVLPGFAFAQTVSGPYVSGGVGAGIFDGSLRSAQSTTKIGVDTGFSGSAAAGWRFGNGFRAEVQGSFQSNDVRNIFTRRLDGNLDPLGSVGGRLSTYSAMANVIYDVPVHAYVGNLQPYVGAGLGYGRLDFGGVGGTGLGVFHLPQNNTYTGADTVQFGSGGALAYQAIVGAAYPIRQAPGLKLTAEYRFFGTARADVPISRLATGGNLVNGAVPASFTHNGFVASDNIVVVGLRYSFGWR